MSMYDYKKRIQKFLHQWTQTFLVGVSLCVVSIASFTFGVLKGTGIEHTPMVISHPHDEPIILCDDACSTFSIKSQEQGSDSQETLETVTQQDRTSCPFVGSVNGTKYYPPTCVTAKRISQKNVTCFVSVEDAESKGYTPSTTCKGLY